MQVKIFSDLKQFTLTSDLTVEALNTIAKYRPEALKLKDADGNPVFAVSYTAGKGSIAPFGVTFGQTSTEGNKAQYVGEVGCVPTGKTAAEVVADKIAPVVENLEALEETLPGVYAEINDNRAALIGSMVIA